MTSSQKRGALAGSVCLHIAIVALLFWSRNSLPQLHGQGQGALSVFDVGLPGPEADEPSGAAVASTVMAPPTVVLPLPSQSDIPVAASKGSGIIAGESGTGMGGGGGGLFDPFAAASLSGTIQAGPTAAWTGGTLDPEETIRLMADASVADVLGRFTVSHSHVSGVAALGLLVSPEGRVIEARYLEGSLGDAAGAALAETFTGVLLSPTSVGTPLGDNAGPVRLVLGPIILPFGRAAPE